MKKLDAIRKKIDRLDRQLATILDQRARCALQAGKIKRELSKKYPDQVMFFDPERESQILDRLEKRVGKNFPPRAVRAVFKEIISACRSLQKPLRVAYLGPTGTNSHVAATEIFGAALDAIICPSIDGVFDSVERGNAEFGVVPIENSTEGGITRTLDLLIESRLMIWQEHVLEISHALLGKQRNLSAIRRIYSHPQAFAQCQNWVRAHLPKAQFMASSSTSEAARMSLEDRQSAAIANRMVADSIGLEVIHTDIQDQTENATRFVVLRKTDAKPTGHDKTTLVFSTADKPGALLLVLKTFERNAINLSRIESRAHRQKSWHYVFFVDLEGHRVERKTARLIQALQKQCPLVKVLGSYPLNQRRS